MKNNYSREYKMVPPEGGWGYVVCAGVSLIFIAGTAHKAVFGLIYVDFLEELGAGTAAVTVVFGVYEVAIAVSGFLTTIIMKMLSVRKVAIIGALIYVVGSIFAIFVNSTFQLVITNGLLQGTGLGILSSASYTSLSSYFERRRVFCLGLCKTCLALTSVVYPLASKFLMTEYGFRGTLAIICGISAHSILGAITLQPVQWHLLKKYESQEERKITLKKNDNKYQSCVPKTVSGKDSRNTDGKIILFDTIETKTHSDEEEKLLNASTKETDISHVNKLNELEIGGLEVLTQNGKSTKPLRQVIYDLLDLTILKDGIYVNIVIGMALTFFSNKTFFILEPLFLDKIKLSKTQIANIMAVGSATDMVVRLLFSLSGIFIQINSRYIFYTGALLQVIFKITIVQFTTYIPLLVLTAALGALKSLVFITQPIVLADYMPIEKYPSAYGFYMLLDGAISITVGPFIGYVRDYTDSYVIAYFMLAMCNLCCVIPWTVEAIYTKRVKQGRRSVHKVHSF